MATVNNSVVRLYQQWANSILCEAGIAVSSLEEFQSGALLTVLLDLLWPHADLQGKLQQQGLPDDLTEETTLRCIQSVLDYITSVGIRCQLNKKDIAHGDVKSLLDLLWILILHFTVHTPDKVAHQRTVKWGKKKLLEWCGDILDDFTPDLSLNLSANLCQNSYLTKLISAICDVQEDTDPVTHLRNAFFAAEEQVGICKDLLDAGNVIDSNAEEHSLLVYLALLRRKAKLLENLPPQWAAGAEGAGAPAGWNLPPEAMQAMGIDAGDYVMYAIVEETYLPTDYIPNDAYSNFPPQLGLDNPRSRPTAQISEIHSSDEESSTKEKDGKAADASKTKENPVSVKTKASEAGDGAFDVMGRLKKKSSATKKKRNVSFSDSMESQEKMNESYNNLLLSDSPDDLFDPTAEPKGHSAGFQFTEYPSTTYTTVPGGFIVTSTMVVPPDHPSGMYYSYPYAGHHPGGNAENLEQSQNSSTKPKTPSTQTRTPDIENAVSHSKSIRDDIKNAIAEASKSKDSQAQSSSSGHSDTAVRGSDNDASRTSLEPLSSSAPVSDEEGVMILSTSQSDQEAGPEMNLQQQVEHPYPRLTDDWMSSTFNKLLNTGSEVMLQTLARAGGRSGLLQVMEDPSTDPAVAEAIHQAITEQVQRQEQELRMMHSETSNSNVAMHGTNSEPSRSSMEVSTSDDDNIDELLDLLERIGQEGQCMRVELQRSYSREVYLQHEHSMEEDSMQVLMQRLTDEIQVLQDENRRMQKQIKDTRDNQRSDKVSIMNLMSTIEDLRTNEMKNSDDQTSKPLVKNSKTISVGSMTDRRILANTQSQTQSSISQMRDKVQQIAPVQVEKGTQILKQGFQRSTLTSTQGLIKTRNAGIQARPMQGRFNVGLQVGSGAYRGKHVATQTGSDITKISQSLNTGPAKQEDTQFSLLEGRIGSLETTLHSAQAENSKLTDRLEEALHLVKENLKTTPNKVDEVSSVESENQKLRQQLDIVHNEKNKLVEDLSNLQEKSREAPNHPAKKAWDVPQMPDIRSVAISSGEDKSSRPKSPSPVKKISQSPSRPGSPSLARPPSPSVSGRPQSSPRVPESPSLGKKMPRPGSATGTRERPRGDETSSIGQQNVTNGNSPTRGRESSSEQSPTRAKEDITAKVQRELEKLFPRNRTTPTPGKNESAPPIKRQASEVKPLLDAEKVKGMSVDELRKKRLAMLVDSYTTKRVSDILKTDKTESPSESLSAQTGEKKPTEKDGRPTSARGRRPSNSNINKNNSTESQNDTNTQPVPASGQLPPWAQRRDPDQTNKERSAPKYGELDKPDSLSASLSLSPRTDRRSPLPEGNPYSSPPWRPPGPARQLRLMSGHSDSVVSELSGQSPQVETEQAKGSLQPLVRTANQAGRSSTTAPNMQQDARDRARSALQRRLKSHLTNMAASAKPQTYPKASNVSPTRTDTRASQQRLRISSSSSSSSVSDLIASLKERSRPLKTSSREDLRSSSPATVSKVTSDGTYISISELASKRPDSRPQSAGRRRRLSSESSQSRNATQTGTRNSLDSGAIRQSTTSKIPSPRDHGKSEQPSPRSMTSQRHSRLAASQTDLTRSDSRQTDKGRWAEPKRQDKMLSRNTPHQQEHDTKSELFHKRSPSPRSQRIRSSLANLTKGHLGSSDRLTRSTSDLATSEEKALLNDPGNIRPPSPNQSLDSSSTSSDMIPLSMPLPRSTMTSSMTSRLPPLGTSAALNQSFSMIRPSSRPPSRAAVFEEETDYVDQLIKKYTAPS